MLLPSPIHSPAVPPLALAASSAQEDGDLNDEGKIDLANMLVSDIPAEPLKSILRKINGISSPDAFEYRRNELKEETELIVIYKGQTLDNRSTINHVSDEEIVDSYRNYCFMISGAMFMFMHACTVAN